MAFYNRFETAKGSLVQHLIKKGLPIEEIEEIVTLAVVMADGMVSDLQFKSAELFSDASKTATAGISKNVKPQQ